MNEDTKEQLIFLSEGNPGALSVLMQLAQGDNLEGWLQTLYGYRIMGSEIWLLYKDVCKQDIIGFKNLLADGLALGFLEKNRDSRFYIPEGE